MSLHYTESLSALTEGQLAAFCQAWAEPPAPAAQWSLLAGATARVLAFDVATGDLVGFATVLADGQGQGFMPMMEVLPGYGHLGVADELQRRLTMRLTAGYLALGAARPAALLAFRPLHVRPSRLERQAGA